MKIALCISGETREYNKFFGPSVFVEYLRSKGCTVDIYGHTWKHCNEVPLETDIIKFKELVIEDQAVIDRWVDENPNGHGWDTPRPAHMQADEWFGRLYHNTRVKLGQHIGGFTCLRIPDYNNYDLCIRWRWDLTLNLNLDWEINAMENIFYPVLESTARLVEELAVTSCNSGIAPYGPCLEDTHYAFNRRAMFNINNFNLHDAILNAWVGGKVSYHTLWNKLIVTGSQTPIRTTLPNLSSFTKSGPHVHVADPVYK